jgi:hypothetical protein
VEAKSCFLYPQQTANCLHIEQNEFSLHTPTLFVSSLVEYYSLQTNMYQLSLITESGGLRVKVLNFIRHVQVESRLYFDDSQ